MIPDHSIKMIIVDLFAGAGGVTSGVERAKFNGSKVCKVIAAVNHDELAIQSHAANHPDVMHFSEDIKMLNVLKLLDVVNRARRQYPNALLAVWASLECTNFSKAKGGGSRDADSRTLAYSLYMHFDPDIQEYVDGMSYIQILDPDIIYIENVEEFMSWGPVDEKGKPVSMKEGQDYLRWTSHVQKFGYNYSYRMINSADHGAYTSRKRYFAQFTRHGLAVEWPQATYAKKARKDVFNSFKKHKAVKEVLDLKDEGNSIFTRKKELSPRTKERIFHGLVKHVGDGNDTFLSKYYSGHPEHKNISIDGPCGAITTVDSHAVVKCSFLQKYNSTSKKGSVKHGIADINNPSPTITTQDRIAVVQAFMVQYHGKGRSVSINGPASTLTTRDRLAFIKPQAFINREFRTGVSSDIDNPIGTILPVPKSNLVTPLPFMVDQSFRNPSRSLEDPAPTILACRKQHYLVNPQWTSKGGSINAPCFTLIARMDKMPPYLMSTITGKSVITISKNDCEWTVKIKLFMAEYGICDIKMRMLRIKELKLIMGFPEDYILLGPQNQQKKFIGNAVETTTAQRIIEASVAAIASQKKLIVA
jgi:DNA (cytosine-5)-methyltransferase 1